jgi:2-dehydropantoate 2-reductase
MTEQLSNIGKTIPACDFSKTPHIAVVGAGAMGCYFGGVLLQAGHQVTFIDVNPKQIATINLQGLILDTDEGRSELPAIAALASDVEQPADLVILFTKTLHTEGAMQSIRHLLTPDSVILSLQNGLGNAERIALYHDKSRIAIGTTLVPADLQSPGHVISHGPSNSQMMDAETTHPEWIDSIARLFNRAGLATELDPDIHTAIWSKVAFNAALNSICAVTGATPGRIAETEAAIELARNVVHETVLVGQANGIHLDETYVWNNVEMAMKEHPDHKPSMLQDIEYGRATEIDAINGAIAKAAINTGLSTPVNNTLCQLMKLKQQMVITS